MPITDDDNLDDIYFFWRQNPFTSSVIITSFIFNLINQIWKEEEIIILLFINQIANHLEGITCLTTKTGLIKSLKHFYDTNIEACPFNSGRNKYNVFNSTPTTYLVNSDCSGQEFFNFMQRYHEIAFGNFSKEKIPQKHCMYNIWIVKPASENQGISLYRKRY